MSFGAAAVSLGAAGVSLGAAAVSLGAAAVSPGGGRSRPSPPVQRVTLWLTLWTAHRRPPPLRGGGQVGGDPAPPIICSSRPIRP